MITSLCPPGSPQHFQAEDPFQLALLIQLLHFPQTSGDFSKPKVATTAPEITIKGNSLMVSNYLFPDGLCLPLDAASKLVDLLISFHAAAMEDATAQGDGFRSKRSVQPTSQQPDVRFAELAQTQAAGQEGYRHLHRGDANSCKQQSDSEDATLCTE